MPGFMNGLFFGGTEGIEPTGRDDRILNGLQPTNYFADDSDADEDIPYENPQTGEVSTLKRAASPNNGDRPTKSTRVLGGKAAVPKHIVADYDSDDGRIITLKQGGYSDEYVAQKLVQEGRIRYVPKTVGSRWLRLRKALEQAENDRLDDELSDWHVGEDAKLHESFKAIDEKFERELQRVMDNKWNSIATNLNERIHKKKYTGRACRERFEGLQNGSALLPIEIDEDKEGRKQKREGRIAAAKRYRAEQAAEAQRLEDEKKARSEERKAEALEKEQERILRTRQREEAKAEDERMKRERAEEREWVRVAKKAAIAKARLELDWERERRRAEKEVYTKLTGKKLRGRPSTGRTSTGRRATRSRDDFVADDADDEDAGDTNEEDEAEMSEEESVDGGALLNDNSSDLEGRSTSGCTKSKSAKKKKEPTKPVITKETLLNPRSIMTDAELETLLFERRLPRRTSRESHPMTVARLVAADEDLSTTELNDLLGVYFAAKEKGNRQKKMERLAELDAGKSAAGGKGVTAKSPEFKRNYEGYTGQYQSLI